MFHKPYYPTKLTPIATNVAITVKDNDMVPNVRACDSKIDGDQIQKFIKLRKLGSENRVPNQINLLRYKFASYDLGI